MLHGFVPAKRPENHVVQGVHALAAIIQLLHKVTLLVIKKFTLLVPTITIAWVNCMVHGCHIHVHVSMIQFNSYFVTEMPKDVFSRYNM